MADLVRVGIVGARFAAQFHFQGYRRVYSIPVEVVGVTSKSAESRDAFAARHRLRAFTSMEELCEAVDVIDICAPGSAHEPIAVAALRRGKHVVIEKPFTGFYGLDAESFHGNAFPKRTMLEGAMASCDRILS